MIEQNVQVVRCAEERIWVRMGSQSGCTACDNGNGCGAGVFAKLLQRKPAIIELPRQQVDVNMAWVPGCSLGRLPWMSSRYSVACWPVACLCVS